MRNFPLAVRAWAAIQARTLAQLPLAAVYRIGFNRCEATLGQMSSRRLRSIGYGALARAISGLDRKQEILLAWQGRYALRDLVIVNIVVVLHQSQKYDAAKWWAARPVRSSPVRRLLDDMVVEILLKENNLDQALAYAAQEKVSRILRARTVAEVSLRRGDLAAFDQAIDQMGRQKVAIRRPYLRWLLRLVDRAPDPTFLVDPARADAILRVSERVQGRTEHRQLANHLSPLPSTLRTIQGWRDYARVLDASIAARNWNDAATMAANPPRVTSEYLADPEYGRVLALRTDALAAKGNYSAARTAMLEGFTKLASDGPVFRTIKTFPAVARRFPNEVEAFDRFGDVLDRSGFPHFAQLSRAWVKSRVEALPAPKVERKRCFVVANGPSISTMPLHLLEDEDIFCVNRGMRAMEFGLPRPRFIAVSDAAVYRDYGHEIDKADVERFFLNGSCLWARPKNLSSNLIAFGSTQLYLSAGELVPSARLLHLGSSVVLSVCQLAHFMGYREIYLIGVDLTYDGPVSHFYGGGDKESRRLASFREGENGATWVNLGFSNLAKVLRPSGTRMYNAGVEGKLSALDRVSFSEITNSRTVPA